MKVNRGLYSHFLYHAHTNYTGTYFADHMEGLNENSVYRYLQREHLRPTLVWKKAKNTIVYSEDGVLIFDDTVLDKRHSSKIEATRRQWSGNAKKVIKGIGVVTCLYYNPDHDTYWVIDYRIFDKERDNKTKIDHVEDMLKTAIMTRMIPVTTVLMDSWYASRRLMMVVEDLKKTYYCPVARNRYVNELSTGGYGPAVHLEWTEHESTAGKDVRLKGFPEKIRQKLFQIAVAKDEIEYIVTNDTTQHDVVEVQTANARRWKIEQLHRELKQLTGIEKNECRKNRSQRNHICCAMLVWHQLREKAEKLGITVYQVKQKLLDDYMREALLKPVVV